MRPNGALFIFTEIQKMSFSKMTSKIIGKIQLIAPVRHRLTKVAILIKDDM